MVNRKMLRVHLNNKEIGLLTYGTALLSYILYLVTFLLVKKDCEITLFLLSWTGIFIFVYIILTWYKLTGCFFTPYTIFVLFFFLFHCGQPFMWAIGIHFPIEVLKVPLYPGLAIPTEVDVIKALALIFTSLLMFHLGAVFSYKGQRIKFGKLQYQNDFGLEDKNTLKVMYYVCLIIGFIAIPLTLFNAYENLQIARNFGYKALYYSDYIRKEGNVFSVCEFMFFPCLVGMLIGSGFDKRIKGFVYIVFAIYLCLNLLSGDRGSWIYKLIVLIWLSHVSYRSINFRRLIKYMLIGMVGLYFVNAIVMLRNVGISFQSVIQSLDFKNLPIISAVFEMGGSIKPTIVLQKYGWDIWPYANTYLLAILGMITNNIFDILNMPFVLLSDFFSQEYLGISWGAGFSIVAESLLNFGPIFAPLFMIILGYVIASLLYVDKDMSYKCRPLRYFFVASTLNVLCTVNRNIIHIPIKEWFYGVIIICIIILFIRKFAIRKSVVTKIKLSKVINS